MKKICFILFLFISVTSYSQTFWYPVWLKSTVKMTGIPGTGTLLGIDISGNVSKVLGVGATGVTGLNDYEPLFGSLTGIIEQDNFWYYDPTTQYMRLGDPSGSAGGEIAVVDGTDASSMTATSIGVSGSVGQTSMNGQYFTLYDLDAELFSIGRATWSTDEVLLFPAAKGALNQSLQVSNVTGDEVTLSWYTPTSGEVNTASNLGGGLANFDSKSGVDLRFNSFLASDFNLGSNLISLDYTNGQKATTSTIGFLTDTDWDTFNNKVGLVHSEEHTAQTTSTGATTVYTTPAADGYYRISVTATVTTAAGSAMDLAVQLRYTEATDNVNKTFPTANVNNYNRTQTNTTGATVAISSVCHVKASTDIKYLTGWSPTGGSPQYNVHITVEKL
jgi:hypothetical protein